MKEKKKIKVYTIYTTETICTSYEVMANSEEEAKDRFLSVDDNNKKLVFPITYKKTLDYSEDIGKSYYINEEE
jgi:hypothetical protein